MEGLKMKIASYSIVTPNGSISVKAEHMPEFATAQQALKNGDRPVIASGKRIPSKEEFMKQLKRK